MRAFTAVTAGAVSIAVGAQITLPMVPVPMSLQTLAVILCGLCLGKSQGAAAAVGYLAFVLLGAPVLADGAHAGGTSFLHLKSAGYVVGFIPGAWLAGQVGASSLQRSFVAGIACHAIVLALGVAVLTGWLGPALAIQYGLTPFLLGAVAKSGLAAALSVGGRSLMSSWRKRA